MKWYEQKYVNHRDWILDSLEYLGLTSEEMVMVLLIDFLNEHKEPITAEILVKRSGLQQEQVDHAISTLCAKNYLKIKASSRAVKFVLDGLFETDTARGERILDSSLFDLFESTFGRTFSQNEMMKISDWNKSYDKKTIILALREADTYGKLSLNYIDKVLQNGKEGDDSQN